MHDGVYALELDENRRTNISKQLKYNLSFEEKQTRFEFIYNKFPLEKMFGMRTENGKGKGVYRGSGQRIADALVCSKYFAFMLEHRFDLIGRFLEIPGVFLNGVRFFFF